MIGKREINSPESLISVIREVGIIPFFKCKVPGWSVEERTAPGSWWDTEDVLGPWDWKIEAVSDVIAYGKFLGGKAAFATEEWYLELRNWRRSLQKYRLVSGELNYAVYNSIKDAGALGAKELRNIHGIRKNVLDSVIQDLQMGTWCLIGDFERVFRGPNLEYSGWQLASHTTPEAFFSLEPEQEPLASSGPDASPDFSGSTPSEYTPFWAKHFEKDTGECNHKPALAPDESRDKIISHILELYPDAIPKTLQKLI